MNYEKTNIHTSNSQKVLIIALFAWKQGLLKIRSCRTENTMSDGMKMLPFWQFAKIINFLTLVERS